MDTFFIRKVGHRICATATLALTAAFLTVTPIAFGLETHEPQRVLLTWSGDPIHTQSVSWRTEQPVATPKAQVVRWEADPKFFEKGSVFVDATGEKVKVDEKREVGEYHATFSGLDPAKDYGYRVGDGETWSEWYHFRTAADKPEKFRFLYVGDAQNDIKSLCSRTFRAAYAQAPDARFIVHAGDLVNEGYDDNLWGEWCSALGFIGAMIPSVPTPGNHDMHRPPTDPEPKKALSVASWWHSRFLLPRNGPEGVDCLRDEAYYFDYQGVRIISLDSNAYANAAFDADKKAEVSAKQAAWLDKILTDNPNRWTVIVHHQPIYSVGKDPENVDLRAALLPIYDKHHVDLVLQGDHHYYSRTFKVAGDQVAAPGQPGTVYVVSVSGPKMYPKKSSKFESLMARTLGDTQMYQVIEVDGDLLTFRAYSATGDLVDAFELKKTGKETSTLVDLLPAAK